MEGLIFGGKFGFKIDWASLIVENKLTVFALFYFVFEGNFPSTSPPYIWRGDFTEGFFALQFWGAYSWRGLYMEGLIFEILRYFRPSKTQKLQGHDPYFEICNFVYPRST